MRIKCTFSLVLLIMVAISAPKAFADNGYWQYSFYSTTINGYADYSCTGAIGATSYTADGYDGEVPITYWGVPATYAAVYQEEGVNGWDGITGFYRNDWVAPLTPMQTHNWQIYVWSTSDMPSDFGISSLSMRSLGIVFPDAYQFHLTLKSKPSSIAGGPQVGTVWNLHPASQFGISFPTYRTDDGLTGYHFALSATAVPEPSSLVALVSGLGCLGACLKQRSF